MGFSIRSCVFPSYMVTDQKALTGGNCPRRKSECNCACWHPEFRACRCCPGHRIHGFNGVVAVNASLSGSGTLQPVAVIERSVAEEGTNLPAIDVLLPCNQSTVQSSNPHSSYQEELRPCAQVKGLSSQTFCRDRCQYSPILARISARPDVAGSNCNAKSRNSKKFSLPTRCQLSESRWRGRLAAEVGANRRRVSALCSLPALSRRSACLSR